jgi:hypothetical protein
VEKTVENTEIPLKQQHTLPSAVSVGSVFGGLSFAIPLSFAVPLYSSTTGVKVT